MWSAQQRRVKCWRAEMWLWEWPSMNSDINTQWYKNIVDIMATMTNPSKPPKSGSTRRKISLPWFRQASIGEKLTRLRLPRQTTVDCHGPSSAPATAAVCHASSGPGAGDKISAAFRRKVLSGSASVEVKNSMECWNWKKLWRQNYADGVLLLNRWYLENESVKIIMGQFKIKVAVITLSDSVFVSQQKCISQPPL